MGSCKKVLEIVKLPLYHKHMLKAYKFQLYPSKHQIPLLNQHFGATRFIYNWALSLSKQHYSSYNSTLSRSRISALLPLMKKYGCPWLKLVNAQSLQQKLIDLERAYKSFFQKKSGFPKFKSKHRHQSFRACQGIKIDFDSGTVKLPKFKDFIKFDNHRQFSGAIKNATISKTPTNKYFISFTVEDERLPPPKPEIKTETAIGIDLGIKHFLTLSDGKKVDNPHNLKKALIKLRREQRKLSRRKKGSFNRNKQRLKVAKIHCEVAQRRKDFHHKLSSRIVHESQVGTIAVEDLNVKGMLKNRRLARYIQDVGWSQFIKYLEYKCEWYGVNFVRIDRFAASSKTCSCGWKNDELKLSDRAWSCSECGAEHDRDVLAACNVRRFGLNKLGAGCPEVTPVERVRLQGRGIGSVVLVEAGNLKDSSLG